MAVTLNAKGTSVPYFKIGKSGVTLFQGSDDPHVDSGYSVKTNDIWFDTQAKTLKFRNATNQWEALSTANELSDLEDVDLTGLADGYFLRYNSSTTMWEPSEVTGGLASDWGNITDIAIDYDGYTGDVWQLNLTTSTVEYAGTAKVNALRINNEYSFPTVDGTAGSVLQTNGAGGVVFSSPSTFHSSEQKVTSSQATTNTSAPVDFTFSELSGAAHYNVFLNRMLLRPSEFSVSGTTVTIATGILATDDELEVSGLTI